MKLSFKQFYDGDNSTKHIVDISHHHNTQLNEAYDDNGDPLYDHPSFTALHPELQDALKDHWRVANSHDVNTYIFNSSPINEYLINRARRKEPVKDVKVVAYSALKPHNFNLERHLAKNNYDSDDLREFSFSSLDHDLSSRRLPRDMVTYSGIGFNPKHKLKDGKLFLPAYTSTSLSNKVAMTFARLSKMDDRHVLQITHPVGSRGIYLGHNLEDSEFEQEHEFLIPRNLTLRVDKTPSTITNNFGKHHIWHAYRETL